MKKFISIILALIFAMGLAVAAQATGVSALGEAEENVDTIYTPAEIAETAIAVPAPSKWANEGIETAQVLGITETGKPYLYHEAITREAFCELIDNYVAILGGVDMEKMRAPFEDTDNEAVIRLYAMGIISGKSETEFAPDAFLTREEAAVILCRAVNQTVPVPVTEMYFTFEDQDMISDWAMDSVQVMCNMGIMNGVGNNLYDPQGTYTVEQAIVTIVRVYEAQEASGIVFEEEPTIEEPEEFVVTKTIAVDDFYVNEAISLVTESASLAVTKEFIAYYAPNAEMAEEIAAIGSMDYTKPKEIYYLRADIDKIADNIGKMMENETESFDIRRLAELHRVNFSSLASLINSSYGAQNLAALTVLSNREGYVRPKSFKENFALYLTYDGACSVLVSFSEIGEGVIEAQMSFVRNGDKDSVFRRVVEISEGLGEGSLEVFKVQ
ncbi:MAG: S-layer homology domain-containing protein [Clostridia bacterium]|nr:S-layer homology domain-containing protein [Clostridia bacterium]